MLNSRQRAQLRAMSNKMDTIFQVGKGGISDEILSTVSDALESRELIKLRVLDTCAYSARDAAEFIAEALNADVVSVLGSRFVLYRESEKKKRIFLS